jgi:hypothetical protein
MVPSCYCSRGHGCGLFAPQGRAGVEVDQPLFWLLNSVQDFRKGKQFFYFNDHRRLLDTFCSSYVYSRDRRVLFMPKILATLSYSYGKGKGKRVKLSLWFNWAPRHEGVFGVWRYNSTHSLTPTLDGGEWSASRLGRLIPRKEPLVPIG